MGWGAGKGMRKPPPSLPEDTVVDTDARYAGTVSVFYKWHGYGFIEPVTKGIVPDDKVFVHWTNIVTQDRFPFLVKDQQVEFSLIKWVEGWGPNKVTSLRAKAVSLAGGKAMAVQEEFDAQKKTFVGDQKSRYNGSLKFYNPMRRFGYVTLDDGVTLPEEVPKEIRVDEVEVNCGGRRPPPALLAAGLAVEFGIVKNRQGKYLAYNMTMKGGEPLSRENLEHRRVFDGQTHTGTLNFFNWRSGWGFILPANEAELPAEVQEKLQEMTAAAKAKGKDPKGNMLYVAKLDVARGATIKPEMQVVFRTYIDDKGAGAFEVRPAAEQL